MGLFMSKKSVSITFFTDLHTQNFFFIKQRASIPWFVFSTQAHSDKPMLSSFLMIFFDLHASPLALHINL